MTVSRSGAAALACLCVLAPVALLAQSPEDNKSPDAAQLAVTMCRTYFMVQVTMQGESERPAEERTLSLIYDTGASTTYVDPDALERASGTRVETGKRARILNSVSGDVTINAFRARITELDHLSMGLGHPVDGILAHDAFNDFLLVMDYAQGTMSLVEGALPEADGRTVFSTRGKDERPWIPFDIDGHTRKLLIDSGSGTAISLNKIDRYEMLTPPVLATASIRFDRMEYNDAARLAGDVTMGDFVFTRPIVKEAPRTELIGGPFLENFRITYHARERKMLFEPYGPGPYETDPLETTGVLLAPRERGFEVIRVLENGPAAGLDIADGDLVTAFDGVFPAERGCENLDQQAQVVFTRERDGQSADVTIVPAVLVE